MATRPELHEANAGQKSKASEYNDNFDRMMNYVEDCMDESQDYVQEQLSTYSDTNTLSTAGEIELSTNSVNSIIPEEETTFVLPTISGEAASKYHQILLQVKLTDTSYISADDNGLGTNYFFNNTKPQFNYTGNYDIIYVYDNAEAKWCCGAIYKGVVS